MGGERRARVGREPTHPLICLPRWTAHTTARPASATSARRSVRGASPKTTLHVCDALPSARRTHMDMDPPTPALPFQPAVCLTARAKLTCCPCTALHPLLFTSHAKLDRTLVATAARWTLPSPTRCAPTIPPPLGKSDHSLPNYVCPGLIGSRKRSMLGEELQRREVRAHPVCRDHGGCCGSLPEPQQPAAAATLCARRGCAPVVNVGALLSSPFLAPSLSSRLPCSLSHTNFPRPTCALPVPR